MKLNMQNFLASLFFLFLIFLLGCTSQVEEAACCQLGTYGSGNNSVIQIEQGAAKCPLLALNGSARLECNSINNEDGTRAGCTYFCDPRNATEWQPQGCREGFDTSQSEDTPIYTCAAKPADPCTNPGCTAMVCGQAKQDKRAYMSLQDYMRSRESSLQDPGYASTQSSYFVSSAYDLPPEAQGLYQTSCDFLTLDAKTNKEFKRSPNLFINTFRFGVDQTFASFDSDRLYLPITDKYCGLTDMAALQKDRYANYPDMTFTREITVNGHTARPGDPFVHVNMWGWGCALLDNEGDPDNPDNWACGFPGTCAANTGVIRQVEDLMGIDGDCDWYPPHAGGRQNQPEGCWSEEFNSNIVKRIRWNCALDNSQYGSKGACMTSCYPQTQCSLPSGEDPKYMAFLTDEYTSEDGTGKYKTKEDILEITQISVDGNGDPVYTQSDELTVSRLDKDYYSSELETQYQFELENGYCQEPGCFCAEFNEDREITSYDEDCTSATSETTNRIPGASFSCSSGGECYSGLCDKNFISNDVCVLRDGTPVECGCTKDDYGRVICKPDPKPDANHGGYNIYMREITSEIPPAWKQCVDAYMGFFDGTYAIAMSRFINGEQTLPDPEEGIRFWFANTDDRENEDGWWWQGDNYPNGAFVPFCKYENRGTTSLTEPVPDEEWLFDKLKIFWDEYEAGHERDGWINTNDAVSLYGSNPNGEDERDADGGNYHHTTQCVSLGIGALTDDQGYGAVTENTYLCKYYNGQSGGPDGATKNQQPINIIASKSTTDPTTSRAYTVLYGRYGITPNPENPDDPAYIGNAIPLISACNMEAGRDFSTMQVSLRPLMPLLRDITGGDNADVVIGRWGVGGYSETLVVFTPHIENGKSYFGDCRADPSNENQPLVYHWGACESCSLATSASQIITPTQNPVCLTDSGGLYGNDCKAEETYPWNDDYVCNNCDTGYSPFATYADQIPTGDYASTQETRGWNGGDFRYTSNQQGSNFLPDPVFLHNELQKYQKGSTIPILFLPKNLGYKGSVQYYDGSAHCYYLDGEGGVREAVDEYGEPTTAPCDNGEEGYWMEYGTAQSEDLPANFTKYVKDQGTAILVVDSLDYPDFRMPQSPGSYILRDPAAVQRIRDKLSYYKKTFPKALITVSFPEIGLSTPRLDGVNTYAYESISKAYALLLNDNAVVGTQQIAGRNYEQVGRGPAPGTIDEQTLNNLDLILLKPHWPEFGYYSNPGKDFCGGTPEQRSQFLVQNLTNISRQLLQDFDPPTLIYLGDRASWAPQCPAWTAYDNATTISELLKYQANLTYAGIIGIHSSSGIAYPSYEVEPEVQPLCILQDGVKNLVSINTKTAYLRLSADEGKCEGEQCTMADLTSGKCNPICADGAPFDLPQDGYDAAWPFGYKCPNNCARKAVCQYGNDQTEGGNDQERLCSSMDTEVSCQYSDSDLSFTKNIAEAAENPDLYLDVLASLPQENRCCVVSETNERGNPTGYVVFSKIEAQGRDPAPSIYATGGGNFPECKMSTDISKSCVFSNYLQNRRLTCE